MVLLACLGQQARLVHEVILERLDYKGPPVLWDLQDPLVRKVSLESKDPLVAMLNAQAYRLRLMP
ncbi:hypothetical protein ES703_51806 [subsurface metagenome]